MVFSFIDTEFAHYFFSSLLKAKPYSKEQEIFFKIIKFLLKTNLSFQSDMFSILEKFDENEKDILKTAFVNRLTEGRGNLVVKDKQTKPFNYLQKKNVYKELKLPFANYWTENTRHPIENYENSNPYMFFNSEQIHQKHSLINVDKKWWVGPAEGFEKDTFKSWEDLGAYKHNFFDIIISDRYCLNNESRIRYNIPALITNLSSHPEKIKNILFIVRDDAVVDRSLEIAHRILIDKFHKLGLNNVNIKIFGSYDTPHDRFIITNSFYLKSGDSIDYFNPDGSYKTKGTTLEINSLSNDNSTVIQRLKQIKKIYSNRNTRSEGNLTGNNILERLDL